jgi:hypothetical protein
MGARTARADVGRKPVAAIRPWHLAVRHDSLSLCLSTLVFVLTPLHNPVTLALIRPRRG